MVAKIRHITIDCANAYELATFWSAVTGWPITDQDEPGDEEVLVLAPDSSLGLLFIQVPESKTVKNRVHLDLGPDSTRDDEVERLLSIGATLFADHRADDGVLGFVVLTDPEGNEFCIERSDAERAAG
ncbi:MAG: VOC family protein [Stackebrandtia sp.]